MYMSWNEKCLGSVIEFLCVSVQIVEVMHLETGGWMLWRWLHAGSLSEGSKE